MYVVVKQSTCDLPFWRKLITFDLIFLLCSLTVKLVHDRY